MVWKSLTTLVWRLKDKRSKITIDINLLMNIQLKYANCHIKNVKGMGGG